jgi:hypothetical protein
MLALLHECIVFSLILCQEEGVGKARKKMRRERMGIEPTHRLLGGAQDLKFATQTKFGFAP